MTWTRARTLGTAVAGGALFAGALVGPAAPAALAEGPPAVSCANTSRQLDPALLACLADAAESIGDSDTVLFTVPSAFPTGQLGEKELRRAADAFADGRLTVMVSAGDSGPGGSTLLALASDQDHRLVDRQASATRLDETTAKNLDAAGLCAEGSLCALLTDGAVTGAKLIEDGQARETGTFAVLTGRGSDTSTPLWPIVGFGAALALALALAYPHARRFATARGGGGGGDPGVPAYTETDTHAHPAPPEPAAATPPGPRTGRARGKVVPAGPVRPATVRSSLHPQGYVELDHCLLRATWADSAAPPRVGEPVDTVTDQSGVLWAVPPSRGTRRGGPGRTGNSSTNTGTGSTTNSTTNPEGPYGR